MKLDASRLNDIDLTKIVYPISFFLAAVDVILVFYSSTTWEWTTGIVGYIIAWTLIPLGFAYLFFKRVRLKFRLSVLSVAGMIVIIVFAHEAISLFLRVGLTYVLSHWDHIFLPMAFGFFFLCDLSKLPRRYWLFLLPLATLAVITNSNIFANIFFDDWALYGGTPGFFSFFSTPSNKMSEVLALPEQRLIHGIIEFLHEYLTFFTLFPVVILYYIAKAIKEERSKTFNTAVLLIIMMEWMLVINLLHISPNGKIILYISSLVFLGSWLIYVIKNR